MENHVNIWFDLGFTTGEFHLLLDSMNGMMVMVKDMTEDFSSQMLTGWEDDKDRLCHKWEVDAAELRGKLQRLTACQSCYLAGWIRGYWQRVAEASATSTGKQEGLMKTVTGK